MQLWLFLWAPLRGKALDVSLGYFLLPLTMVLAGRFSYRDRLSLLQKLAVACAMVGVGNELYQAGGVSWPTLVVALGYPLYFILRRRFGTDNLGGLWCELALMLPAAAWFAFSDGGAAALQINAELYWRIPLLGVISAVALVCYILASRLLPFSLFGLLSYVEPVLLVIVALLLGESIGQSEWPTYLAIWLAVLLRWRRKARSTCCAASGSDSGGQRGAAVDHDVLHGDMAGQIGGREQHRVGDLIRAGDFA